MKKIKEFINNSRQNIHSHFRKTYLYKNTNPDLVKHLKPTITCPKKWYGTSYGGFYINPNLLTNQSVIYSFGIGKDIRFDMACSNNHQSSIYAFDPTPKSIKWIKEQKLPANFHFLILASPLGIKNLLHSIYQKHQKRVGKYYSIRCI